MKLSCLKLRRAALIGMLVAAPSGAVLAATTVTSSPMGVMSANVPASARGLALPLPAEDAYIGIVAANTPDTLALSTASLPPGPALAGLGAAYVEVVTGPFEGERLDLDLAATASAEGKVLVVAFGAGTHSTLANLGADALAGARVVVRPHVTLARLQAMFSPALVGHANAKRADGVQLFENGQWVRYSLRPDGSWLRAGQGADVRDRVIPPDVSLFADLKSGAKRWVHHGVVRTNAFRKNLSVGLQAFASGFPVDLSPVQVGGFVDPEQLADQRWKGGEEHEVADWFERHAVSTPMPVNRYFLRADGTSWKRVNDNHTNYGSRPILGQTDALVLRRHQADPAYVIPVPFQP
jgi:hypothetical protein